MEALSARNRPDTVRPDCVAMKMAIIERVRNRLISAVALYLARPVRHSGASASGDPQSLASVLQPGDVLLTDGNTRAAALVRLITRSSWAHVAMYVGALEEGPDPRCIVEADVVFGVRAVPLSELKGLGVRVLRPRGLADAERRRLADWVVSRIGDGYDLKHAWALASKLLRLPLASFLASPPAAMAQTATRFICSTLLAQAFLLVGYSITPVQLRVREADHRYVTPSDFESAPVFEVVRPQQI
jgi:Permuted papain-like amidase enzyme, YaeF/YiiX, C92 family